MLQDRTKIHQTGLSICTKYLENLAGHSVLQHLELAGPANISQVNAFGPALLAMTAVDRDRQKSLGGLPPNAKSSPSWEVQYLSIRGNFLHEEVVPPNDICRYWT